MSWITLTDAVRAIEHAISCEELEGPTNACAPEPATGAAFAAALGAAVHRPAIIPLPTFAVRTIFGEMGDETLLASQRAVPQKLLATGFHFLQKDIVAGCEEALLR
jgi:NAD dependent epimerase/dehydratase family enzyme